MTEEFFQQFHSEITKQSAALDSGFIPFLSSPSDAFAPTLDEFEFDLDNDPLVAAFKGAHTIADPNPTFTTLRSETFGPGPASAFTADSESAYEYSSVYSGSLHNNPTSVSTYSIPSEFNFNFSNISMDNSSEYSTHDVISMSAGIDMREAFGALSSPVPESPPSAFEMSPFSSRSSHSDYEPTTQSRLPMLSSTSDYNPVNYNRRPSPRHQLTISPSSTVSRTSTSPQLPVVPPLPLMRSIDHPNQASEDPKKKFQCPNCPRGWCISYDIFIFTKMSFTAFARAFNLKTHRETHNPNRAKPHACTFAGCGRSFSRKHDLGRHMISIHREDPEEENAVGVSRGVRSRCDSCGRSWVEGKEDGCDCDFEVR
jgi:hypothetical protein